MHIKDCIASAIADCPNIVPPEAVFRACAQLGTSESVFCDLFAKEVAASYVSGSLTWADGDAAMNAIFGCFSFRFSDGAPFPDYAYKVFLAFDDGEPLEVTANERITKELLAAL